MAKTTSTEIGERVTSLEANSNWIKDGMKSLEDKFAGFTKEIQNLESSLKVMFTDAKEGFLRQHNVEMKKFHQRIRILESALIFLIIIDLYFLTGALLDDKKAVRLQELARGAIYKSEPTTSQ